MRSMSHFDTTMATMTVPPTQRTFWRGLYLSFLRSSTPEENRDQAYPLPGPPSPAEPSAAPGVTLVGEAVKAGDPQDFTIDGFDIHRAGASLGEFTWREALQAVAAKRGTVSPQPAEATSSFLDLAKAMKELSPDPTQPLTADGIIDLVTKLDALRGGGGDSPQSFYVDSEGNKQQLAPGEPIVIKQAPPPAPPTPGKSYFLNPETHQMEEIEAGKPIIITVKEGGGNGGSQVPFPVFGQDGQPVYDRDGKPIVADLQPMMKWMGFQADQKRAGERHDSLIGLVKVVKDNVADGISALKVAADEIRHDGTSSTAAQGSEPQVYECGDCHTQFKVPAGPFAAIACPHCKHEYSREEVQQS